jgi:hypothetical protein
VQIDAVDPVAELGEDVPQRQAVLAARHPEQQPVVRAEHVVLVDGPLDLAGDVVDEVGAQKLAL